MKTFSLAALLIVLLTFVLALTQCPLPTKRSRAAKEATQQKNRGVEAEKKEEKEDEWRKNFWKTQRKEAADAASVKLLGWRHQRSPRWFK